jgi:hypothetical protein
MKAVSVTSGQAGGPAASASMRRPGICRLRHRTADARAVFVSGVFAGRSRAFHLRLFEDVIDRVMADRPRGPPFCYNFLLWSEVGVWSKTYWS